MKNILNQEYCYDNRLKTVRNSIVTVTTVKHNWCRSIINNQTSFKSAGTSFFGCLFSKCCLQVFGSGIWAQKGTGNQTNISVPRPTFEIKRWCLPYRQRKRVQGPSARLFSGLSHCDPVVFFVSQPFPQPQLATGASAVPWPSLGIMLLKNKITLLISTCKQRETCCLT